MNYLVEILGWLNRFSSSRMTSSASTMRELLDQKIQSRKFISAYQIIERMKNYGRKSTSSLERVEIWADCGLAIYQMGNLNEAIKSFKQALAYCPPGSHSQAIIRWLLGAVQWRIESERDMAIVNWKETLEELTQLEQNADHENKSEEKDWYKDRKNELNITLKEAVSRTFNKL